MTDLEKLAIQSSSKNYAIISFVLSIISFLNLCSGCLFFIPIISLILGIVSVNKSKSIPMPNEGLATAGIILSIIGLVIVIFQFILGIVILVTFGEFTAFPICFLTPFGGYFGGY